MRLLVSILLLAALTALAGCAQNQTVGDRSASIGNQPLRPISKCIVVDRVGEWYVVDPKTVIVRTGPEYFRIDMEVSCPRLGYGPGIRFRLNPALANSGRLCGDMLEAIYADQIPCPIAGITPINEKRFRELEDLPDPQDTDG